MKRLISSFLVSALCGALNVRAGEDLMRILSPIRLASEPGADLDAQVAQTRQILEKFDKAGFRYAIWAVDRLPEKSDDLKPWVRACLGAFPGDVVLALDAGLTNGVISLPAPAVEKLLLLSGKSVRAVMINFVSLNNGTSGIDSKTALDAVAGLATLGKSTTKKPVWLFLDGADDQQASRREWVSALDAKVDAFYLDRGLTLAVVSDPNASSSRKELAATGKPVICGVLDYLVPASRAGIENDLSAQYLERMGRLEGWLIAEKYAGFVRGLGPSIPTKLDPRLDFTIGN